MLDNKKTVRGKISDTEPNPVDIHVGNRIRLRRMILGLSQQQLASKLGLTFQQVQKYEKGGNRVGASRLFDISKVLKVSMDFFFQDMERSVEAQSPMMLSAFSSDSLLLEEENEMVEPDPMKKKETLELVRAYYRIANRKLAKKLFDIIVDLSKSNIGYPEE